jgi:hypothetical protein
VSDIDTAVVDSLKVLDPAGRLEKRPNCSRAFGSSLQFAICREIFRNCRESRSYWLSNVLIISRLWKEFSRLKEQGEFLGIAGKVLGIAGKILGIAGKSSVRIANGGRVWRGLNSGPRVRPPAGLVLTRV